MTPPAIDLETAGGLRVLHVVQKFSSGVGTSIAQYTHSLPEAEHHLLSGTPVDAEGDLGDQGHFASVRQMNGGTRDRIRQVRQVVDELKPDVVHGHSSHGGAYARLAVRRGRVRLVYTPHCYGFERRDVSAPIRTAFWAAEALLALNTSAFAGCSDREVRLSAWPTRSAPRYLVPNIAPAHRPGAIKPRSAAPVVAGGGRLSSQKDPAFFLTCVTRLRAQVPGLHAVWLGDGDRGERALLEDAGVEVTGWLPRNAVLTRLAGADLYVHSARWEGFPLMVAEAVALKIPTLVRRLPCFADVPRELTLGDGDIEPAAGCLSQPEAASENHRLWSRLLQHNTVAAQRAALLTVYRGGEPGGSQFVSRLDTGRLSPVSGRT